MTTTTTLLPLSEGEQNVWPWSQTVPPFPRKGMNVYGDDHQPFPLPEKEATRPLVSEEEVDI